MRVGRREFRLIEQDRAVAEIARAHLEFSRFHDLYDALTWRLCRDPLPVEAFEVAPDTFLVKKIAPPFPGFCTICIVYTIDQDDYVITVEDLWVGPPYEN